MKLKKRLWMVGIKKRFQKGKKVMEVKIVVGRSKYFAANL